MKKYLVITFLFIPILVISCTEKKTKPRTKEIYDNFYNYNGELDSITQVILNLDMVKSLPYKPTIMSPRMTVDENDSIWYQIGENTDSKFQPEFNFYYYRKTKQLKYLDPTKNSLVLIK